MRFGANTIPCMGSIVFIITLQTDALRADQPIKREKNVPRLNGRKNEKLKGLSVMKWKSDVISRRRIKFCVERCLDRDLTILERCS